MKEFRRISAITAIPTLGVIAFVAVFPYLDLIGKMLVGLCAIVVGCGCVLALELAYHHHSLMASERLHARLSARLLSSGDTAIYMREDGYDHVSAEHVQAMLPPPNVTVQEIKEIDSEEIIKLHQKHLSLRAIAKATGHSYYQVQKCVAEWDKLVNEASSNKKSVIDPQDWRSQT